MNASAYDIPTSAISSIVEVLAAGLAIPPHQVMAYASNILCGSAGPTATVLGRFGEVMPLFGTTIVMDTYAAPTQRLHSMFEVPAQQFEDRHRDFARSVHPNAPKSLLSDKVLPRASEDDWLTESRRVLQGEKRCSFAGTRMPMDSSARALEEIANPALILSNPGPEFFDRLISLSLDRSPLVLDSGRLIGNALKTGREWDSWKELVRHINDGLAGTDYVPSRSASSPMQPQRLRLSLLAHLEPAQLEPAFSQPELSELLSGSLLCRPRRGQVELKLNVGDVMAASRRYREALEMVMRSRYAGRFITLNFAEIASRPLYESLQEFEKRLGAIPPDLRRFAQGLHSLPYRFLWTAGILAGTNGFLGHIEAPEKIVGYAIQCLDEHVQIVSSAIRCSEAAEDLKAAQAMWERILQRAPCDLRTIMRTYPQQRKALHQPVLQKLFDLGCVDVTPQGAINLVDGARFPADAAEYHSRLAMARGSN